LSKLDQWFWVAALRWWSDWKRVLVVITSETVVRKLKIPSTASREAAELRWALHDHIEAVRERELGFCWFQQGISQMALISGPHGFFD
jgi:hypothetical protein